MKHQIKGIAQIDIRTTEKRDKATGGAITTTEETLLLSTKSNEIISFASNGDVSKNCSKVQ